jgi:predicted MFS family arabinose efflux permease
MWRGDLCLCDYREPRHGRCRRTFVRLAWRAAFRRLRGLLLAVSFARDALPDARRRTQKPGEREPAASWAFLVMLGLGVALEMTMPLWSPAYLEQVAGMPRTAAVTAAAAFPAAMLLGRSVGSFLLRRMAPAVLYPATLCLIVPGFLAFWGGSPPLSRCRACFS